jgi:hypothetical protein
MIAAAVFQKKPWGLKYIWFKKSGIRTLLHNDRIFSTAEVYPPCSERASYYHNGIRIAYAFQVLSFHVPRRVYPLNTLLSIALAVVYSPILLALAANTGCEDIMKKI